MTTRSSPGALNSATVRLAHTGSAGSSCPRPGTHSHTVPGLPDVAGRGGTRSVSGGVASALCRESDSAVGCATGAPLPGLLCHGFPDSFINEFSLLTRRAQNFCSPITRAETACFSTFPSTGRHESSWRAPTRPIRRGLNALSDHLKATQGQHRGAA
jgi:hypothetical protein